MRNGTTRAVGGWQRLLALILAGWMAGMLGVPARAAEKPLSSDDVLLMLLAGASTDKMLSIVEQRGIDFRMNPDLANKFQNAGADDLVIEALMKAEVRTQATAAPAPTPAPAATSPPPASKETPQPAESATPTPKPSSIAPRAKRPPLPDPSPAEIQKIIQ